MGGGSRATASGTVEGLRLNIGSSGLLKACQPLHCTVSLCLVAPRVITEQLSDIHSMALKVEDGPQALQIEPTATKWLIFTQGLE